MLLFTGTARLVFRRRLVRGSREVLVAAAAATAPGNQETIPRLSEIVQHLARFVIVDDGAHRYRQFNGLGVAARAIAAFAVAPAPGGVFRIESKMEQGIMVFARHHNDIATVAPIAAARSAARDKFLAPECHAPVSAVASLYADSDFVDEHEKVLRAGGGR